MFQNLLRCRSGTVNKVYVKFYYESSQKSAGKTVLNSQIEPMTYNQQFRPDQENIFTISVPHMSLVNFSRIQVGFADEFLGTLHVEDDDWVIKRLEIYDSFWNLHFYISRATEVRITKSSGMVDLVRYTKISHHVSPRIKTNLHNTVEPVPNSN